MKTAREIALDLVESLGVQTGPRCPDCGSEMQGGFFRVSENSTSAIKWRCKGKDESFHEFIIDCSAKLAQFFRSSGGATPPAASPQEIKDSLRKWLLPQILIWRGDKGPDKEDAFLEFCVKRCVDVLAGCKSIWYGRRCKKADGHTGCCLYESSHSDTELPPPAASPQPALQETRFMEFDDPGHPANIWWEKHGQYHRSGGGRNEFIWACRGWIAREQLYAGVPVTGDSLTEKSLRETERTASGGRPARELDGWLPCAERMPNEKEIAKSKWFQVAGLRDGKWRQDVALILNKKTFMGRTLQFDDVSHWRPLFDAPEPPAPEAGKEGKS